MEPQTHMQTHTAVNSETQHTLWPVGLWEHETPSSHTQARTRMRTLPGTHASSDTNRGHTKSPCGHAHALCMTPRPQAQPHGWTHPRQVSLLDAHTRQAPSPHPQPSMHTQTHWRLQSLLHRECSDACMSGVPLHTGPTLSVQGLLGWGVFPSCHQSRRRPPPKPCPSLTGVPPDSVSCVPDCHVGHCPP